MSTVSMSAGVMLLALAGVLPGHARAQDRDPTRAPPEANAPAIANVRPADQLPAELERMSVMVRDGTPYLVVGTRLMAAGQMVGDFKIDRITESEIWLRRGKELRKVSRFGAIQRREASPVPPAQH